MAESDYCKTCKRFMLFPVSHKCPPGFDVVREDDGIENSEIVYAGDAEQAACLFAEENENNWDYQIANGSEVVILVRPHGTEDKPKRFTVSGEQVIQYHAREEE